jgi:hypothetical protein
MKTSGLTEMTRQFVKAGSLITLIAVLGSTRLLAATIDTPSATPSSILINTATVVTVSVVIDDPALVPGSVSLLRQRAAGTQPSSLGQLHDDGKNGDAVAGDHIYTIQVTLNEPSAAPIQMQVSAAFRGALRRVLSSQVAITVLQSK